MGVVDPPAAYTFPRTQVEPGVTEPVRRFVEPTLTVYKINVSSSPVACTVKSKGFTHTAVTVESTMTFSRFKEPCVLEAVKAFALMRVGVPVAVESIKLKSPLPPLVVSIPTVQPSNRRP